MIVRILAMLLLLAAPLRADEARDGYRRVDVTVTDVNGPILAINRGAQVGIQRGDSVLFPSSAGPPLVAVVRVVRARDAEVELEDSEAPVAVGLRGEVLVPKERPLPEPTNGQTPDHPPWQAPVGLWEEGKPLLAPIVSPKAEERESEVYGRVFTRYQDTEDSISGRHYARFWTGLDYNHTNPFGQGGLLRFKGDVYNRSVDEEFSTEDDSTARLDRLSYVIGNAQSDSRRFEVGRFLPHLFPQFGLLDGAEYVVRNKNGSQLGASAGFLPSYDHDLGSTDDISLALFGRWVEGPKEMLAVKLGLQKTWHKGDADRDLLATGLNWRIDSMTTVRVSALADYFDGTDTLESEGLQLTETHASIDRRFGQAVTASLYGSYLDWPQLLKDEFPTLLPATIQDQKVLRGGVSASIQLTRLSRVFARYDSWSDDLNSGTFTDSRLDMRDLFYGDSESSIGLFDTRGSFSSGLGARVRHTHFHGKSSLSLEYETTQYQQAGFQGIQNELQQQAFLMSLNSRLQSDLDLFADAQQRFGDEQDSFAASIRLTWRF